MSCISHINYTASVGRTPINVKNANSLQWMAGQTGESLFSTQKARILDPLI